MGKMKNSVEKPLVQEAGEGKTVQSRKEVFRFGEASVKVDGVDVNIWQCSIEGTTIGFVKYIPAGGTDPARKARDYGFRGFHSLTLEDAEGSPATDVNKYSSLRGAARAVVACHYGGRRYTYIHDNIAILDGKVVTESVFKGRKVIKPTLEG
jgi:hypothetical protein